MHAQWNGSAWEYTGEVTDAVEDDDVTTFYIELDGKVSQM